MDREKWEKVLAERRRGDEQARIEEQRRKVGITAEVFISDRLKELGRIRLGLLREIWIERGGRPSHILPAVHKLGCRIERFAEYDNALFVLTSEPA